MKDEMTVREPASKPVSNYASQAADAVEEGLATLTYLQITVEDYRQDN